MPVPKARVLVTDMPQMLRDIIEAAVKSQIDMELVVCDHDLHLAEAIQRRCVDVAIVGRCGSLLLADSELRALVVTADGRAAEVLELRRLSLAEPSPQSLLDAIRRTLGDRRWRLIH